MHLPDPVALTQALVRMDTVNPPGNEHACARLVGDLLDGAGFQVQYTALGAGRSSLVATLGTPDAGRPSLAFTGHLDTVPLGAAKWSFDPFAAEIRDGRLYGRGASDMKSGVAAAVVAALRCASWLPDTAGVALIITAGEETGCDGAHALVKAEALPPHVGALVVGEPTGNRPMLGHKGALWVCACTHGRTAHGSMPEQGDNAIYRMARVVLALQAHVPSDGGELHGAFGHPTLNVGTIEGGLNINSVPDRASVGIDIRTVPGMRHAAVLANLGRHLGGTAELRALIDAPAVHTDAAHPWVRDVFAIAARSDAESPPLQLVPYFTDASVLKPALGDIPTVILGPGEPAQAHQTDEYAVVARIEEATAIYEALLRRWCDRR